MELIIRGEKNQTLHRNVEDVKGKENKPKRDKYFVLETIIPASHMTMKRGKFTFGIQI